MPRLIPRLARLSLPTAPTSLPRTIGLFRIPAQSSSSSALPTLPTFSSRFFSSSLPTASLFTSPRSSILSRLPTLAFSPQHTQIRTLAYGTTYQPSQRKRKRKYGFLARLKGGRLGTAILARRRIRGRRFLSH